MARTDFTINAEATYELIAAMEEYGRGCGYVIDDVLHKEGGKLINQAIIRILPESGRKWKGKRTAAKRAQPFKQEDGSLSVTIRTKSAYHYLYFPDDGTNTKNHIGYKGRPREFMYKGAESRAEKIIDLCVERLIEKWESD